MTPRDTIIHLILSEPLAHILIILIGIALLSFKFRGIRKSLSAASSVTDRRAAIDRCNDLIGVRAKAIVSGMMIVLFGLCFLFASGISAQFASGLFTVLIFTAVIPTLFYFMFWGVPDWVLRWFLTDLKRS